MRQAEVDATLPMLEYVARRLMAGPPPKWDKCRRSPGATTKELLPQYAALFAERKPDGAPLTLHEIGQRMGVTREAVRIMRKRYFPELGSIRVDRNAHIREQKASRRFAKLNVFRSMVRGWLKDAGYFQCCCCLAVRSSDEKSAGKDPRCKRCNADGVRAYRATEHGRQKGAQWKSANPDKLRAAQRRFRHKYAAVPPQPCPNCGLSVCGNPSNNAVPMRHKRPDGQWCKPNTR